MKKILTTLLCLAACLACQADVIVYKIKATATVTGNGTIEKEIVQGWLVFDPNNSTNVAEVGLFPQLKSFQIFTFDDATTTVVSAKGKNYTVISWPGNSIGRVLANGINAPAALTTGTITPWLLPKTMKLAGNEVYPSLTQFEEDAGTLVYDQATTVSQNGLDGNFSNTVTRLAQIFLKDGLTQLPTQSQ